LCRMVRKHSGSLAERGNWLFLAPNIACTEPTAPSALALPAVIHNDRVAAFAVVVVALLQLHVQPFSWCDCSSCHRHPQHPRYANRNLSNDRLPYYATVPKLPISLDSGTCGSMACAINKLCAGPQAAAWPAQGA
jgi:hypothetical protein